MGMEGRYGRSWKPSIEEANAGSFSQPLKVQPLEKNQAVKERGIWKDGVWRVVMKRPLVTG